MGSCASRVTRLPPRTGPTGGPRYHSSNDRCLTYQCHQHRCPLLLPFLDPSRFCRCGAYAPQHYDEDQRQARRRHYFLAQSYHYEANFAADYGICFCSNGNDAAPPTQQQPPQQHPTPTQPTYLLFMYSIMYSHAHFSYKGTGDPRFL